jgi:hypothetical protein
MAEPIITILEDAAGGSPGSRKTPQHNDLIREVWSDGATVERRYWDPDRFPATPKPLALTPNQVIDLMLAEIGAAGFSACVRSDADAMVAWRYKMSVARDISKTQAAAGLSIIVSAGLMTADQRAAILAAWPSA